MQQISIQYFKTPFGELIIGVFQGQLCLCDWRYRKMRSALDNRLQSRLDSNYLVQRDPLIERVITQLEEYFAGARQVFDLPLKLVGTDFQRQVWRQLLEVSYAQTVSYLTLSKALGNEKAIRAVAAANGANGISIIVPCHRIIGSDGKLVGYAGGLDAKHKLLQLESRTAGTELMTQNLPLF